jgi:K+-sensing histidine kinase KdpD
VALVSHEFWRRLEVILSSAGNLRCDHDQLAPEKHEQLLQPIQKSVRSMSGMMEELPDGSFSGKAWKKPPNGPE